jgi:hypothetical protein
VLGASLVFHCEQVKKEEENPKEKVEKFWMDSSARWKE